MQKSITKIITKYIDSEAGRYIIVGGCTTLVNLIVYVMCYQIFGININISNTISVIVAILFAYVTNKIFVFQSRCTSKRELLDEFTKFIGARALTMIIEVGGVFVLYEWMHIHEFSSKILVQVIVLISNFIISKFFVFKK